MIYNPYDLVNLIINDQPFNGRPIAFDSEVTNQKTMTNAFGKVVKPTVVMTMCPDCGQGFQLEIQLPDPPFPAVVCNCPTCRPAPPPLTDPFINPVETGRVPVVELDPLIHDIKQPLVAAGNVAEQFVVATPPLRQVPLVTKPAQRPAPLPPAEGVGEEFDDHDLLDES